MAKLLARSVPIEVPSPSIEAEAPRAKIHQRQLVHAGITVVLMLLYLVVGPAFVNTVEPRVVGIPLYVFWTVFLLPALNFVNLVVFARFMIKRERQRKRLEVEPWR
jgi:hypothetical protein